MRLFNKSYSSDTKAVAKVLEKYGTRANKSVFECMFSAVQLEKTKEKIANMIDKTSDRVIFYRICVDCYTKTDYLPLEKKEYGTVTIV